MTLDTLREYMSDTDILTEVDKYFSTQDMKECYDYIADMWGIEDDEDIEAKTKNKLTKKADKDDDNVLDFYNELKEAWDEDMFYVEIDNGEIDTWCYKAEKRFDLPKIIVYKLTEDDDFIVNGFTYDELPDFETFKKDINEACYYAS